MGMTLEEWVKQESDERINAMITYFLHKVAAGELVDTPEARTAFMLGMQGIREFKHEKQCLNRAGSSEWQGFFMITMTNAIIVSLVIMMLVYDVKFNLDRVAITLGVCTLMQVWAFRLKKRAADEIVAALIKFDEKWK